MIVYHTGMRKRKKILLPVLCVFLGLLAVGSFFHLTTSFGIHRVSEERLRHAVLEREYVSTWLESLKRSAERREYAIDTGEEDTNLKSIEIRGATSPVQQEKIYAGNEERFDVIEY